MMGPIRSILMLHSGALGDTVLQLRLAQMLRQTLGEVTITWLGRDCWLPIVRRCAHIDRLVGLEAMRGHRLFGEGERTDADLAEWLGTFDLILNGLAPVGSAAEARLKRFARHAAISYDTRPQMDSAQHITYQWLEQVISHLDGHPGLAKAVRDVGMQALDSGERLIEYTPEDVSEATQLLKTAGLEVKDSGQFVLVHPGSGGRSKCWPIEKYVRLVEVLREREIDAAMVVGPVEMDLLGDMLVALRSRCRLITDPPLTALMGLIGQAQAYVGNDSGPTHLAGAMGAATVGIFGPTQPEVWRPIGAKVTLLQSQQYKMQWNDLPPETVADTVAAKLVL